MSQSTNIDSIIEEERVIAKASHEHIEGIKAIVDANRHIFGFIPRAAFQEALEDNTLIVATQGGIVVGFLRYHHRRDLQTTLYEICVSERRKGIGRRMLYLLLDECNNRTVLLKCPSHLEANVFYGKNGFCLLRTQEGKHRTLNVWCHEGVNHGRMG